MALVVNAVMVLDMMLVYLTGDGERLIYMYDDLALLSMPPWSRLGGLHRHVAISRFGTYSQPIVEVRVRLQ